MTMKNMGAAKLSMRTTSPTATGSKVVAMAAPSNNKSPNQTVIRTAKVPSNASARKVATGRPSMPMKGGK